MCKLPIQAADKATTVEWSLLKCLKWQFRRRRRWYPNLLNQILKMKMRTTTYSKNTWTRKTCILKWYHRPWFQLKPYTNKSWEMSRCIIWSWSIKSTYKKALKSIRVLSISPRLITTSKGKSKSNNTTLSQLDQHLSPIWKRQWELTTEQRQCSAKVESTSHRSRRRDKHQTTRWSMIRFSFI